MKKISTGIRIVWDDDSEAFATLSEEEKKAFKLRFYLEITDSNFLNYSDLEADFRDQVFCFTNKNREKKDRETALSDETNASAKDRFKLTGDSYVYPIQEDDQSAGFSLRNSLDETVQEFSEDEVRDSKLHLNLTDQPAGLYKLWKQDEAVLSIYKDAKLFWKPVFGVIEVFLFDDSGVSGVLNGQEKAKTFTLQFGARSTIWRYYIIPKYSSSASLNVEQMQILNGRNGESISFINKGQQRLSDGKEAMVFDSETPILLRDKTDQKYQLKSADGKVLIKRLPTPSTHFIHTQTETDQQHFYSEMYVYL